MIVSLYIYSILIPVSVGIPLRDSSQLYEPTVQARQHRGSIQAVHKGHHGKGLAGTGTMTTMELGMYVLLTAFCFAIIVFVISCVVYASKFRPAMIESGLDPLSAGKSNGSGGSGGFRDVRLKESTTNAHDWVWLGRSTIDRQSIVAETNTHLNPRGDIRYFPKWFNLLKALLFSRFPHAHH